MTHIEGTTLTGTLERVVDGDTLRVQLSTGESESLRLLNLDTEETHAGGSKPVTPFGRATTEFCIRYFEGVREVTVELPGREPLAEALQRHRDNYGRLLSYVHRGEDDFQHTLIAEGYSPYFMKYGHAAFASRRAAYERAEQRAQSLGLGLWNQGRVNGRELRNYAALGTWWRLRAHLIDRYRALRAQDESLRNTRLDYAHLRDAAERGERVTVFSELRSVRFTRGGEMGLIDIGSESQPFKFVVPDARREPGASVLALLLHRYVSGGETHPRLSYAYLTGALSLYRGEPEMVLRSTAQIHDQVLARQDVAHGGLRIVEVLPNPEGPDAGAETLTLRNDAPTEASLDGHTVADLSGRTLALAGALAPGQRRVVHLRAGQLPLNNTGDTLLLLDDAGRVLHEVRYEGHEAREGRAIPFLDASA